MEEFVEGSGVVVVGPGGFLSATGGEEVLLVSGGAIEDFGSGFLEVFGFFFGEEGEGGVVACGVDVAIGSDDEATGEIGPFFVAFVSPVEAATDEAFDGVAGMRGGGSVVPVEGDLREVLSCGDEPGDGFPFWEGEAVD